MAFPSTFPTDIDSYVPKTDGIDDVMAVDVNELQSAIVAIETALGVGFKVDVIDLTDNDVLTWDAGTASWINDVPYIVPHGIVSVKHTADSLTAGQVLIATAATTFGWSPFYLAGTATKTYTFPGTAGTVALGTGTATYLAYWSDTNTLTGSSTLVYTPTAAIGLTLQRTVADPAAANYNFWNIFTGAMTANNGQTLAAITNDARISGAFTFSSQLYGLNNIVRALSGAIVAGANAFLAATRSIVLADATSSVNKGYAYYASGPFITAGGVITEAGGFYIAAQKVTGVITGYGVNQIGTTDINYFGGTVGIKMTPTYTLDVTGNIRCSTGFGCNGALPQTAYSLGAASSDLATVIALANKLRTMAINDGTGSA